MDSFQKPASGSNGDNVAVQSAPALLMVRPASFGFDEQTAQTNNFQHDIQADPHAIQQRALAEFETYVTTLREQDITVIVFDDTLTPRKPNAIFPNNWFTTWPDGSVYLYPLATRSRRPERDPEILNVLSDYFSVSAVRDISASETQGTILEATGAVVFDHVNKIAYGCISPRCDQALFVQHSRDIGYRPIPFHAYAGKVPVYHTNVMMGVQRHTAVICSESITSVVERREVLDTLRSTGHTVIEISQDQMNHFCGNLLEVRNSHGKHFLILSSTAYHAFTPKQRQLLGQNATFLPMSIPVIEEVGGGSARCMIAEIFLPGR